MILIIPRNRTIFSIIFHYKGASRGGNVFLNFPDQYPRKAKPNGSMLKCISIESKDVGIGGKHLDRWVFFWLGVSYIQLANYRESLESFECSSEYYEFIVSKNAEFCKCWRLSPDKRIRA